MVVNEQWTGFLEHLRRAALRKDGAGATDAELLEYYVARGDEAAFEGLLRRHGPMVLGVCRRVLRNEADAEDAFQATFLVLVRKAGSILPRSLVGNWLYGVAHTTALKAKAMNSKRRAKERAAGSRPRPETSLQVWEQLQAVLDEELSRLPDKYRVPVVLCELEGKTVKEAARQLGAPQGTVASRLSRARGLLAKRLARRGLTLSGGALGTLLAQNAASAGVPHLLLASTIKAASLFAAGKAVATGVISIKVAALAEGMVKTMLVRKLIVASAILLLMVVAGTAAGLFARSALGQGPPDQAALAVKKGPAKPTADAPSDGAAQREQLERMTWMLAAVDDAKGTINVDDRRELGEGKALVLLGTPNGIAPSGLALNGLKVTTDAQIRLDGKKAKLGDLKAGMPVSLRWTADHFTIANIEAISRPPLFCYRLEEIDLVKNTVSVTVQESKLKLDKVPVAEDATILLLEHQGSAILQPIKLKDLRPGMFVSLELTAEDGDRIAVQSITAGKGEQLLNRRD